MNKITQLTVCSFICFYFLYQACNGSADSKTKAATTTTATLKHDKSSILPSMDGLICQDCSRNANPVSYSTRWRACCCFRNLHSLTLPYKTLFITAMRVCDPHINNGILLGFLFGFFDSTRTNFKFILPATLKLTACVCVCCFIVRSMLVIALTCIFCVNTFVVAGAARLRNGSSIFDGSELSLGGNSQAFLHFNGDFVIKLPCKLCNFMLSSVT